MIFSHVHTALCVAQWVGWMVRLSVTFPSVCQQTYTVSRQNTIGIYHTIGFDPTYCLLLEFSLMFTFALAFALALSPLLLHFSSRWLLRLLLHPLLCSDLCSLLLSLALAFALPFAFALVFTFPLALTLWILFVYACVCDGSWWLNLGWMPRSTSPQQYWDPASLVTRDNRVCSHLLCTLQPVFLSVCASVNPLLLFRRFWPVWAHCS